MLWVFLAMIGSAVWAALFQRTLATDGWSSFYVTSSVMGAFLATGVGLWTPWTASWTAALAPLVGVCISYAHSRAAATLGPSEATTLISMYPLLLIVLNLQALTLRAGIGIALCVAGAALLGGRHG